MSSYDFQPSGHSRNTGLLTSISLADYEGHVVVYDPQLPYLPAIPEQAVIFTFHSVSEVSHAE